VSGSVSKLLAEDHERLDALLQDAQAKLPLVDSDAYEAFRAGLLRHIAIEEKVLIPLARRLGGDDVLALVKQVHADHAALAALLVPTPTPAIVATIRAVLESHNPLEEGPIGLYARCERLAGSAATELMTRLRAIPPVRVAPHCDAPKVHDHIESLLRARHSTDG
jgi:hypothetical protein